MQFEREICNVIQVTLVGERCLPPNFLLLRALDRDWTHGSESKLGDQRVLAASGC